MKRFSFGIIAIFTVLSTPVVSADFFLDEIADDSAAQARMERVSLPAVPLRTAANRDRYRAASRFIESVKNESLLRAWDGRMSEYQLADVASELEFLTYELSNHFANLRAYERTGNPFYRDLAARNLDASKNSYDRLRAVTRR